MNSVRRYLKGQSGAAAAEFAVFVLVLAPLLLNLGDMGYYAYVRMQLENAAQAGAQAAWANCTSSQPSSTTCPDMSNAVAAAIKTTSLGANVTWSNQSYMWSNPPSGPPKGVDYYCATATNSLSYSNSPSATCAATSAAPGTYVMITVSYAYKSLFSGATISSLFPSTLTATTYQRLS